MTFECARAHGSCMRCMQHLGVEGRPRDRGESMHPLEGGRGRWGQAADRRGTVANWSMVGLLWWLGRERSVPAGHGVVNTRGPAAWCACLIKSARLLAELADRLGNRVREHAAVVA